MKPLSARARLAIAMGGLVGLVTLMVTMAGRSVSMEVLEEVRPADNQKELATWKSALQQGLASSPQESVWASVQTALDELPEGSSAVVVDREGVIRAAKPETWRSSTVEWDGEQLSLEQTENGETSMITLIGGKTLEVESQEIGRMFVFEEPRHPAHRVTRTWIGVGAGGIVVGMIAAWFLAGGLTGPLRELTDAARLLAKGDRSIRVIPRGEDEVGELATAFNDLADSLSELESARRRLVSETAHELRTPLTRLRCQLEGVEDGLLSADGRWLRAMGADLHDLQKLVDDLQDLALAESGQLTLEVQTLGLERTLRTLIASYEGRLVIALAGPADAAIAADPTRFRQIVGNLLDNAARWSPVDSGVEIEWNRVASDWEIAVIDHGPGLTELQTELVFDRFYRGEPSRARDSGGTGLGLAVVRRLTEAQGGNAGVDSEVGHGSRFWIRLPAASTLTSANTTT
ncbi:MAG: HAMP domain-containing protein [Thermoanaerobaculia bacterium]|nr:HAMP domain-containing protein [Thermoanaerobaculia bacterium]